MQQNKALDRAPHGKVTGDGVHRSRPHTGYWPSPGYWRGISDMGARLPKGNIHVTSTLFGSGGMERAVLGGERAADRVVRATQLAVAR